MRKNKIAALFFTFMKIGLFTFGGGYAMLSILRDTCVQKKNWITDDDMMNITVIAESTPGPIAVNCATFIGYKQAGLAGALAATAGVILPSFVIIYLISIFFSHFLEFSLVANAFRGIRVAVGFLILDAAFSMVKRTRKEPLPRFIAVCSFLALFLANLFSRKLSTVLLMLCAAAVSLAVYLAGDRIQRKEGGGK